jgi:polyisoprenyl-phosphate glycosyltransferase
MTKSSSSSTRLTFGKSKMYSVIIPVYRNAEFVPKLVSEFDRVAEMVSTRYGMATEFVFVVDGSPDNSYELLEEALPKARFPSQLVLHARNFGSFAAIRTGLKAARGEYFGIIAADLQEPPELLVDFLEPMVEAKSDIVIGCRVGRSDPAVSRASANIFWSFYRRWINPDIPKGGVDVFGCNKQVRDELLKLDESNSSLIGLVFWLGFRRSLVPYERRERAHGKSAWTFRKKLVYLLDSVFAFTDLPIRIMTLVGFAGVLFALLIGIIVSFLRIGGMIDVPGYAATIIVIAFFGALNTFGLGLVGAYAWRAYENTKRRPLAVIRDVALFDGARDFQPSIRNQKA